MDSVIISAFVIILSESCATDNTNIDSEENKDTKMTILPVGNFWQLTNKEDFIAENPGKYLEFDLQTDYCAAINAQKLDPLGSPFITSFNGVSENCAPNTRSLPMPDGYTVRVKGVKLGEAATMTRSSNQDQLYSVFGQNADFVISRSSLTRSSAPQDSTISMYVPEMIEILSPSVTKEEDMFPLCYYKDMQIRWNADKKNLNGVMVIVEWTGTMIFGADSPDIYIRRTDVINDDNGSAILNNAMFEDIPDTALVYITLLRGNVESVLVDDYSYKLLAGSHSVLPIILIRNLKES